MPAADSWFGGKVVMVLGCFAASGVGELHQIHGIMDGRAYFRIDWDIGIKSAATLLGSDYIYQQENDPKHISKAVHKLFFNPWCPSNAVAEQISGFEPAEHH